MCVFLCTGNFLCSQFCGGKEEKARLWSASLGGHLLGVKIESHGMGMIRRHTLPSIKWSPNNSNTSLFYGVDVYSFICSSQPSKVSVIILIPQIKELKLWEVESPFLHDRAWVQVHYSGFLLHVLCNTVFIHLLILSFTCLVMHSANICLLPIMCQALC